MPRYMFHVPATKITTEIEGNTYHYKHNRGKIMIKEVIIHAGCEKTARKRASKQHDAFIFKGEIK
jgi:hypothetical protein